MTPGPGGGFVPAETLAAMSPGMWHPGGVTGSTTHWGGHIDPSMAANPLHQPTAFPPQPPQASLPIPPPPQGPPPSSWEAGLQLTSGSQQAQQAVHYYTAGLMASSTQMLTTCIRELGGLQRQGLLGIVQGGIAQGGIAQSHEPARQPPVPNPPNDSSSSGSSATGSPAGEEPTARERERSPSEESSASSAASVPVSVHSAPAHQPEPPPAEPRRPRTAQRTARQDRAFFFPGRSRARRPISPRAYGPHIHRSQSDMQPERSLGVRTGL